MKVVDISNIKEEDLIRTAKIIESIRELNKDGKIHCPICKEEIKDCHCVADWTEFFRGFKW